LAEQKINHQEIEPEQEDKKIIENGDYILIKEIFNQSNKLLIINLSSRLNLTS
jgi:hypothetical protein